MLNLLGFEGQGFLFKYPQNFCHLYVVLAGAVHFFWAAFKLLNLTGLFTASYIWSFLGVSMFIPEWKKWIFRGY
jgi:hypothetical protein